MTITPQTNDVSDKPQTPAVPTAPAELPEFWPVAPPEPVRPVWLPWSVAVLAAPLLWICPKRFGPHMAAAGWVPTLLAFVLWVTYGIGCVMVALETPECSLVAWLLGRTPGQAVPSLLPAMTWGEVLRVPLAACVGSPGAFWFRAFPAFAAFLVVVPTVVLGWLTMPFISVGERQITLLARSHRLALWSMTSLVILGLVLQGLWLSGGWQRVDAAVLAVGLYYLWLVWMIVRAGSRYAGPAKGLAWQPQPVLCNACGYSLTALRPEGTCPECGEAIATSMPDFRRPSPFAASSPVGRPRAFLRTFAAVLSDRRFFAKLRMRGELPAARGFAAWNAIVTGFGTAVCVVACLLATSLLSKWYWVSLADLWPMPFLLTWVWSSLGVLALQGLAVLLHTGRRPMPRVATVTFYNSAWLLPIVWTATTWFILAYAIDQLDPLPTHATIWRWSGIDLNLVAGALLSAGPLLLLLYAWARLRSGLRQTRYAPW